MKSTATAATAAAVALFSFSSSVSAHLFLQKPVPIQGNAIKNPLDPSGSNFPCHGVAPPGAGGVDMAAGSTQQLIFQNENSPGAHDNTAVHGGGSCQISITYETDLEQLKDPNNWRVLYSIMGGCPTNSRGNLDDTFTGPKGTYTGSWQCDDPSGTTNGVDCVNKFNFKIPEDVQNGQATLAWTWFNTIGNREMYMNCAAVNIQGGTSNNASALEAYPPMFVANLASVGGGTCRTTEMYNIAFPDPGQNVIQHSAKPNMQGLSCTNYPMTTPSGCAPAGYASGPIGTGGPAPGPPSSYAPPTSAPTSAPATYSQPPPPPATYSQAPTTPLAPTPSSPTPSVPTTLQTSPAPDPKTSGTGKHPKKKTTTKKGGKKGKPTSAAPGAATGTGAVSLPMPSASGTASSAGSCPAGSVPCIGVNSIVCVDDNHFGICDYNNCAISQAVAPGTMCSQGAITWAMAKVKKRHLNKHVHGVKHAS